MPKAPPTSGVKTCSFSFGSFRRRANSSTSFSTPWLAYQKRSSSPSQAARQPRVSMLLTTTRLLTASIVTVRWAAASAASVAARSPMPQS